MKPNSQSDTILNDEIGGIKRQKNNKSTGLACQTHNPGRETRIIQ